MRRVTSLFSFGLQLGEHRLRALKELLERRLPPLARTVTNRWELSAAPGDAGATAVTFTTTIEPLGGPRGRIGQRILGRVLGKAADDLVKGLAAHDHTAPGRADA